HLSALASAEARAHARAWPFLAGHGLPRFVEQEFRDLLTCGVLARAVTRLRCADASCGGRRMAEHAAALVERRVDGTVVWELRWCAATRRTRALKQRRARGRVRTMAHPANPRGERPGARCPHAASRRTRRSAG